MEWKTVSGLIFSVHIFERLEQWLSDKDRRLYAAEEREQKDPY